MRKVGTVLSSQGQEVEVLVVDERVELGSISQLGDDAYGIVVGMCYQQEETGIGQRLVARLRVLGKLRGEKLLKLKRPIPPFTEVYEAPRERLEELLKPRGERISVGKLLGSEARVYLDPSAYTKHIAVLAATGAGKSCTCAVLIREFSSIGLPVVVFDTHGEYADLLEPLLGYKVELKLYAIGEALPGAEEFRLPVSQLEAEDFCHFVQLTEHQRHALEALLEELRNETGAYEFNDIIDRCERLRMSKEYHEGTLRALRRKLLAIRRNFSRVFEKYGVDVAELVRPFRVSVVDASNVPQAVRQAVVAYLCKELLEGRIKNRANPSEGVKHPLLLVVEEAHNYASPDLNHSCRHQLRRIASEGRKFGIGLCVVSQRPSKVDDFVLSQCNTGIYMHLVNPADKEHVKRSFERVGEEVVRGLDSLDVGECVIVGEMLKLPFVACEVDRIQLAKAQLPTPERLEAKVGGFEHV